MIVVNEIHDFEEIPPQVQYFVVFGSKKASATADAFFCLYFSIDCLSERTSGRPSPVSAAKNDTSDENGDEHIHLLDAENRPFVSSG